MFSVCSRSQNTSVLGSKNHGPQSQSVFPGEQIGGTSFPTLTLFSIQTAFPSHRMSPQGRKDKDATPENAAETTGKM